MTKADCFPAHRGLRVQRGKQTWLSPDSRREVRTVMAEGQRATGAQRRQLVKVRVREGFLEEGVSALRCEGRVHMSLLRE